MSISRTAKNCGGLGESFSPSYDRTPGTAEGPDPRPVNVQAAFIRLDQPGTFPKPCHLPDRASPGRYEFGGNCREPEAVIDELPGMVLTSCMEASAEYLFDMPVAIQSGGFSGWQDRLQKFNEMSAGLGGLLPRSVLPEALGLSRQRVGQLCESGIFEVIHFCGTQFVTGRSLAEYHSSEKAKGGRGHKLTRWQTLKFAAKLGASLSPVIYK